jgi:peptidoglycan/LPS O-acetylase OafA/YrhL
MNQTGFVGNRRQDIQALRGISVLAVVFFHLQPDVFKLGFYGVDVFFVISGFVVAPLIYDILNPSKERSISNALKDFYIRRIFRLLPASGSFLIFLSVPFLLFAPFADYTRVASQALASIFLVGNYGAYKFVGNYFSPNINPLVHLWSLSVEEQIYIFLPLILIISMSTYVKLKEKKINLWSKYLSAIFIFSLLFSILPYLNSLITNKPTAVANIYNFSFYAPFGRLWEFIIGGFAYFISLRSVSNNRYIRMKIPAMTTILIILFIPIVRINSIIGAIFIDVLVAFFMIIKSSNLGNGYLISSLTWLGDRSYSIYLWHLPVIYFLFKSPLLAPLFTGKYLSAGVALFLTLVFANFSFKFIESKYRRTSNSPNLEKFECIKLLLKFGFVPILIWISLYIGAHNSFWGIAAEVRPPQSAMSLGESCQKSEHGGPCIFVAPEAHAKVLLVGDSHAESLAIMFRDAALETSKIAYIWPLSSCPIQLELSKNVAWNCVTRSRKILELLKNQDIEKVVVSIYITKDSDVAAIKSAISLLQENTKHVLIVGNSPVFSDKLNFMQSQPVLSNKYDAPKTSLESELDNSSRNQNEEFLLWAQRRGIFTLNPFEVFCDLGICRRYSNKNWLFIDDNHLSIAGANLLKQKTISFMRK